MGRNVMVPAALFLACGVVACGGGTDEAPAAATSATPPPVAAQAPDSGGGSEGLVREVFSYAGGARDPFESLLSAESSGPELPDLTLVAIYLDEQMPRNSVAVLRERLNNRRYNVRPGDQLGRLRVLSIDRKDVTFVLDDFGTERQETLSLRKPEEVNP